MSNSTHTQPLGLARCGHCTAVAGEDRHLIHDKSCPVSANIDAQLKDDAAWFLLHPGCRTRRRPIWWCEQIEMRALAGLDELPPGTTWHGDVVVTELAPGVRAKHFGGVCFFIGGAR